MGFGELTEWVIGKSSWQTIREMRNSDLIHSVEDEFTSFHYSTIPCVRQDYQASVNIYNFNKL
ncbi:MAG TPA: hypothetical protein VMW91_00395 [Desulfosporosinus sp.]|nr:hypothetical protein [Desulfosporosinus sp.]